MKPILVRVAEETLAVLDRGAYTSPSGEEVPLRDAVERAARGTRTYSPAELDALVTRPAQRPASHPAETVVEVTRETTAQAARRLVEDEGVARVAALNFASAKNPGGGFLSGAKAQEEDLARVSALFPCLIRQLVYYDANLASGSALYTDHVVYSPDVPFFRDDRYVFLPRSFQVSVITAPAPNAGQALSRDPACGARIRQTLWQRAGKVLKVAEAEGHRCLVLGAWGCGVFRNDPDQVAGAFASWLFSDRFRGAFDRVVFAVYDPQEHNLCAFEKWFGPAIL